ncbi:actin-like ATPase domain-containing protein [Crassisporium funariophilum]|nr:actin-like ATPase domain-containing protein [Crassisporium funariophilum]
MKISRASSPGPGMAPRHQNGSSQLRSPEIVASYPRKGKVKSTSDKERLVVSIDFGTTCSGVAYGSPTHTSGQVRLVMNWPSSRMFETSRKVPTCLLYDNRSGQLVDWGFNAKNASLTSLYLRCQWFKAFLDPSIVRGESTDPHLPKLPPGKTGIDLVTDYLGCLWAHAQGEIRKDLGSAVVEAANVWLLVPSNWDAKSREIIWQAGITIGIVGSVRPGSVKLRQRLRIMTDAQAASVHCAHLLHLSPDENFLVCDAGGGTVDLAIYKLIGNSTKLETAELSVEGSRPCGSLFLDLHFQWLVKLLMEEHPIHRDEASLANFMLNFSEVDKLRFRGTEDEKNFFHFTCFNVEDRDDPAVGLINGELDIPGNMLSKEVFEPVITLVLRHIAKQLKKTDERVKALLLVGGFSGNDYLFQRIKDKFQDQIQTILRPPDADTSALRGAVMHGMTEPLISRVIAPHSYIMKVRLPAEQQDYMTRPAYIKQSASGLRLCEKRVQYLVHKGDIIRKGERIKTKLSKYSRSGSVKDGQFDAIIYTSDSPKVMRYTDEGNLRELCRWSVDLTPLPYFGQDASNSNKNGFYTEFEVGLELDSSEVRGVLLYQGVEWGRAVFDFLV